MKNKIIILVIIILILILGVVAYAAMSKNTDNSVKTVNNTTKNVTNISISQNNTTNEKTQYLSKTVNIKDDPNFATTKKIGKEDTIYIFYNSGYNGQEDIHRGLLIFILNASNELEGNTQSQISHVVVKFQNSNNGTVYKTYNPNYGPNIKVKVPENLTPISATVYYKAK